MGPRRIQEDLVASLALRDALQDWIPRQSRDRKTMTARDVTGFYSFLNCTENVEKNEKISTPHFGAISFLHRTENLEKKERIHRRSYLKTSGDGTPKLQISVPCRGRNVSWQSDLRRLSIFRKRQLVHIMYTLTILVSLSPPTQRSDGFLSLY